MGLLPVPVGSPGDFGFLKSIFVIHYGLGTWTGGPVVLLWAALALYFGMYWLAAPALFIILAPYGLLRPSRNVAHFLMNVTPSSRGFKETSFTEDPVRTALFLFFRASNPRLALLWDLRRSPSK